jgi:predicted GIY-YIG superfamily endonuclease
LEIVQSLASTDKTGAEKREAAVKKLTAAAKKQGVSASESLIRFTVESAVQRHKLEQ